MQRDKQRDLRKLQDIEEKKAADQAQISKDKVGTVTNSTCTTNTNQVKAMEEGKQQMLQLMQHQQLQLTAIMQLLQHNNQAK